MFRGNCPSFSITFRLHENYICGMRTFPSLQPLQFCARFSSKVVSGIISGNSFVPGYQDFLFIVPIDKISTDFSKVLRGQLANLEMNMLFVIPFALIVNYDRSVNIL